MLRQTAEQADLSDEPAAGRQLIGGCGGLPFVLQRCFSGLIHWQQGLAVLLALARPSRFAPGVVGADAERDCVRNAHHSSRIIPASRLTNRSVSDGSADHS